MPPPSIGHAAAVPWRCNARATAVPRGAARVQCACKERALLLLQCMCRAGATRVQRVCNMCNTCAMHVQHVCKACAMHVPCWCTATLHWHRAHAMPMQRPRHGATSVQNAVQHPHRARATPRSGHAVHAVCACNALAAARPWCNQCTCNARVAPVQRCAVPVPCWCNTSATLCTAHAVLVQCPCNAHAGAMPVQCPRAVLVQCPCTARVGAMPTCRAVPCRGRTMPVGPHTPPVLAACSYRCPPSPR